MSGPTISGPTISGPSIDLNADLGEGYGIWRLGDDEALLEVITSANVACGFHAGDPSIMRWVCETAVRRGVAIGAQVSYPDLAGFGRRAMEVEPNRLANDVIYQIGALDGFARLAGSRVAYVKPHGALYNRIVDDEDQAAAVVDAVVSYDRTLEVLGLPGSVWLTLAAEAGLGVVHEGFADRAYTPDGRLVPRGQPGAVLTDPEAIAASSVRQATSGDVDSICVHGDTPGAVRIARRVHAELAKAGFRLAPFAPAATNSGE